MENQSSEIALTAQSVALRIQERIAKEPSYRAVLYKMLDYCKEPKTFLELEVEVLSYPEMKIPLHTSQILLSWLLGCDAMRELMMENEPSLWVTTEAGVCAFEKEASEDKLEALFMSDPTYKTIYLMVLNFCKEAKSRMEIEAHLANQPLLENPKLYASYFIDTLEVAGGLIWNGAWMTTQKAYAKLSA